MKCTKCGIPFDEELEGIRAETELGLCRYCALDKRIDKIMLRLLNFLILFAWICLVFYFVKIICSYP